MRLLAVGSGSIEGQITGNTGGKQARASRLMKNDISHYVSHSRRYSIHLNLNNFSICLKLGSMVFLKPNDVDVASESEKDGDRYLMQRENASNKHSLLCSRPISQTRKESRCQEEEVKLGWFLKPRHNRSKRTGRHLTLSSLDCAGSFYYCHFSHIEV